MWWLVAMVVFFVCFYFCLQLGEMIRSNFTWDFIFFHLGGAKPPVYVFFSLDLDGSLSAASIDRWYHLNLHWSWLQLGKFAFWDTFQRKISAADRAIIQPRITIPCFRRAAHISFLRQEVDKRRQLFAKSRSDTLRKATGFFWWMSFWVVEFKTFFGLKGAWKKWDVCSIVFPISKFMFND